MDVFLDGCFEGGEGASDLDFGWGLVGVEQRAQQPVSQLGVEDGDADAWAGEVVGVAVGEAVDEPVQAQAFEVIAHLAWAVGLVEVRGHECAQALVGEAGQRGLKVAQGAGQGCCSFVAEAQGSGSLALSVVGLVDALQERRVDGTALAGSLDHKQPLVDSASFLDELGKVVQAGEHVDVGGFVDDGLDARGRL